MLAPYTGKPSAFTVDQPLPKRLPPGTTFGYLQCAVPVCALINQIATGAVKTIGGKLAVVKAGAGTNDLQTAFSSLLEKKPSALLLPGVEPASISAQLKQANQAKIPIASTGIMDIEQHGIQAGTFGTPAAVLAGKLLAAQVVASDGAKAKAVFYNVPELSFSAVVKSSFTSEMQQLCKSCPVRSVDIGAVTIGSTAPARVVSDLQSHADTTTAVFAAFETATGLPAAMKVAGLKQKTTGFAPTPSNLQDIKAGKLTSGVGIDIGIQIWSQVDAAARLILKAPLTKGEMAQIPPVQILTAKDLPQDNSKGWSGYPDFPQRFAKLWSK